MLCPKAVYPLAENSKWIHCVILSAPEAVYVKKIDEVGYRLWQRKLADENNTLSERILSQPVVILSDSLLLLF